MIVGSLRSVAPRRCTVATILVVDDDRFTRAFYEQAFRRAGYRVVAVSDGPDALRYLEKSAPPDAVVLGSLRCVSVADVYKEIRARKRTRAVPIVIVTGTDSDRGDLGVQGIVRTSVYADAVVSIVDEALQHL